MNMYSETPLVCAASSVAGLPDDAQDVLNELVAVWDRKRARNVLRQQYVDMHVDVKNLGIAIPEEIANGLEVVSCWPEKAVHSLASRCVWDGVVSKSGTEDPFELSDILRDNRFDVDLPQAIVSELIHSVAFISTTPGDTVSGEPEVVVMPHSAQWASAVWDRSRRAISAGLLVNATDKYQRPVRLTLLTPFDAIVCETRGSGWFVSDVRSHGLGRVPMEALPFRPSLDRPFGRSRVSRAVMTITDRAVRAALRMDISSELYTAPGLLLRGLDEETWSAIKASWTWQLGSVKGITRDEDGNVPEVTSIPQQSMLPFVEQLRELAMEFAAATSLPVSSLGIVQDNPSSADAIYAAKEELVVEAANANRVNGYALSRVYQNIVMLRDGLDFVDDELKSVSTRWRNPAMPSIVSQADAMVKQISALPDLALTDVALEEFGYTAEQIVRIRSEIRRAKGVAALDKALSDLAQGTSKPTEFIDVGEDEAVNDGSYAA